MFQDTIFKNYTGADASGEILIMLAVAFALGYILRWLMNRFWGCQHCAETELEAEIRRMQGPDIAAVAPAAVAASTMPVGVKKDDLKIVEGIGPKIEELLHNAGIKTWKELSDSETARLQDILARAGDRFRMHNPETWAEQAELADAGKWQELEEYQDFLNGGRTLG